MTTSEFRKHQEDPCVDEDGFEIVGGEECRDCTPNPNAFVPDWRQQDLGVPFKNEKTCQYCVVLTTDADGEFVNANNIQQRLEQENLTDQSDEQTTMVRLGNSMSFNTEAYGIFLNEYAKLDPRGRIILDDPSQPIRAASTPEQIEDYQEVFNTISCEEALLTTSQTVSIGTPFKFLVCIPCESIDSLEDVPSTKDLNTFFADSEVTLDGRKLYAQLVRLSFTLSTFARYTNKTTDFTINKKGTKEAYTPDIYGDRGALNTFKVHNELKNFLNENDYGLGLSKVFKLDLAEEIKIVFDNSDPAKPFVISKVFAKKKYCEFEELTKSTNMLNKGLLADQTVMGYISKLPEIDSKLRAPNPTPWIDFLLDYTFPQLEIVSGGQVVDALEDSPVDAFFANSLDKAFNLVSTAMSDVISETFNEWSKRNCAMTRRFGTSPEDDIELFNFQEVSAAYNRYVDSDDSFVGIIKHIKNAGSVSVPSGASTEVIILKAIGLCGMGSLTEKAVRCLLRGLSLNEFLKLQTKTYLKKLEPSAIALLAQTLPVSVSQEITSGFIEDFAGAPLPWETGYSNKGVPFSKEQAKMFYELSNNDNKRATYEVLLSTKVSDATKFEELEVQAQQAREDYETSQAEARKAYMDDIQASEDKEFDINEYNEEYNPDPFEASKNSVIALEQSKDEYYDAAGLDSYYSVQEKLESSPTITDQQLEELGYQSVSQFERDAKILRKLELKDGNKAKRELEREAFDQATLYRPGPNLQAALTEAYTEQLLNYIGASDLQRVIDNIPDVIPIGPVVDALKCPYNSLFSPPIKRFLGTTELNTAFDCKEGNSIRRPFIPKLNAVNIKNALSKNIADAFLKALSDKTIKLLIGLLDLAVSTLDEAVCKTLGGIGDNLINEINGGGEDGFFDVMADAFSANPDLPQNARDLRNGTMDKVLDNYGVRPQDCPELNQLEVSENYRNLYKAIGYALSVKEMKELFSYRIEEYNPLVLTRVQQSIAMHAECFKDSFNNPQSVGKLFRDIASTVPLDKKNDIRDSITDEDSITPAFISICLSQQQYDKWLEDRIAFLMSLGIPEDVARDNALGEDQNNANSLEKLLDANNDLESFVGDNIANDLGINDGPLFDDKGNLIDPSCYPKGGLLDTNSEEIEQATDAINSAYFDTIELTLVKDLTVGSIFGDGLLDMIMANTDNDGYSAHHWKSAFPFYRKTRFVGYEDTDSDEVPKKADIFYPKTIGARYYDETSEDTLFDSALALQEGEVPPSYSLEFEQEWDTNFETKTSRRLQKRTSRTELVLAIEDETTSFSIDQYKISNYKEYVNNKSGEGPEEQSPPETVLIMKQPLHATTLNYLEQNFDLTTGKSHPLRAMVFNNYVKKPFDEIGITLTSNMGDFFYSSSYGKINELVYNSVKQMCYNDIAGSMNTGFIFGYDPEEELTEEDLNYVDPEPGSLSYTKKRNEKILGRSQTDHPRVYFLDPEKHGGSYIRPRIYIEPPRQLGWVGLRDAIIPEADGCEPSRQVIVNMKEIKEYVNNTKSKIARDPRLNNASDCIKQIPFDIIVSQQSRAQMEGAIKAALRVYCTEAYIYSSPVFVSIFSGFDGNYDDSLFEMVTNDMIEDMLDRSGWSKGLISNGTYVNTFLEQCVQMYARKYYSGELEVSEEGLRALTRIEESQMRYKQPSDQWLKDYFQSPGAKEHTYLHREPTLEDMPYDSYFGVPGSLGSTDELKRDAQENIIQNFYLNALLYDDQGEKMFLPIDEEEISVSVEKPPGNLNVFVKKANKFFRFFTRMYTVRTMRKECMVIFKDLLKDEFKYIVNSMANSVDKKAEVFRTNQHFSTRQGVFFGNNTNFGTLESVLESSVRGDVNSVQDNISSNFFDAISPSDDQIDGIKETGCFIIQKYFRLIEKVNLEESELEGEQITQSTLASRNIDLYNIVNPESFLEYLGLPLPEDSEFSFDDSLLISDLFGDIEIVYGLEGQELIDGIIIDSETGEVAPELPEDFPEDQRIVLGTKGSIGIKKGLRLLYVPNEESYNKILEDNFELGTIRTQLEERDYAIDREGLEVSDYTGLSQNYMSKKTFLTAPHITEDGTEHASLGLSIPIVSVEIDEFDKELVNLENFSDDDYKCLLTKLVNSEEYRMLFDYCFPVNIFVGHNMVHTSKSLYMSIGQGPDERLKHDGFFGGKELSDTPRFGQPDDDILDTLDDTKDVLRNVFANIYTSEDFQKTFEFDFEKDKAGLRDFISLSLPSLRRIGGHKKARRPFDKDGNECTSPVGKLFGGK